MDFDISIEHNKDLDGVTFKISCEIYEINVHFRREELALLDNVGETDWKFGSVCAGKSAGAEVHWAVGEAGLISIMVGSDDETWDISVSIPTQELVKALADAEKHLRKPQIIPEESP